MRSTASLGESSGEEEGAGGEDAARLALKARKYSAEVVTLAGSACVVRGGGARRPHHHRLERRHHQYNIKVWRDGACERTIEAHTDDGIGGLGGLGGLGVLATVLSTVLRGRRGVPSTRCYGC